ncbi:hypothetical protein U1Q18_051818 [Sarracenia purpurea var. burkii]
MFWNAEIAQRVCTPLETIYPAMYAHTSVRDRSSRSVCYAVVCVRHFGSSDVSEYGVPDLKRKLRFFQKYVIVWNLVTYARFAGRCGGGLPWIGGFPAGSGVRDDELWED